MSPEVPNADLRKVQTRCSKERCRTGDFVLHRHHKGNQSLFVHAFVWRIEQETYIEFVKRYYEFREEDIVRVCARHHREIHEIYDIIIAKYCDKIGRRLSDFTWAQAEELMERLIARCNKWLKVQTPGSKVPWPSNGQTKRKAQDFLQVILDNEEWLGAPPQTDELPL